MDAKSPDFQHYEFEMRKMSGDRFQAVEQVANHSPSFAAFAVAPHEHVPGPWLTSRPGNVAKSTLKLINRFYHEFERIWILNDQVICSDGVGRRLGPCRDTSGCQDCKASRDQQVTIAWRKPVIQQRVCTVYSIHCRSIYIYIHTQKVQANFSIVEGILSWSIQKTILGLVPCVCVWMYVFMCLCVCVHALCLYVDYIDICVCKCIYIVQVSQRYVHVFVYVDVVTCTCLCNVYLTICLSVCLSVYLSICLSVYLSICLCNYVSILPVRM